MNDKANHIAETISKTYQLVETVTLDANSTFPHPAEPPVIAHLDDSALTVMTDFEHITPTTIYPTAPIDNALTHMRASGEHVQLVVDEHDAVLGIISSGDIQGVKPVKIIQDRRIQRKDVQVQMVMTRQKNVLTFDSDTLRHAKVGNIVSTLKEHKQHYALVIEHDPDNQEQRVRGLFSLSNIGNMLGLDVASLFPEAHSLAELQHIHS